MPIPCRHLMTHYLSKRGCKCVALRRPKLGKLRRFQHNLSMRELVTSKKIFNFFIDRAIFNESGKPISESFTMETSIPCRRNSCKDDLDLKFSDSPSYVSPITFVSHIYLFRLSTETEYQMK